MSLKLKLVVIFLVVISICTNFEYALSENRFTIDGIEFFVSNPHKTNWYYAHKYCRKRNMQLAELTNKEIDDQVISHLRVLHGNLTVYDGIWWVGGTDLGSEGTFYWINSGKDFEFKNFERHNPSNSNNNEHCVTMMLQFWQWNDDTCNKNHYFICQQTHEQIDQQ